MIRLALLVLLAATLAGCAVNPAQQAEQVVAQASASDRETFNLAQAWLFERARMDGTPDAVILESYIAPRRHLFPYDLPPPGQRSMFDPQPMGAWCDNKGPGCMAAASGLDRNVQANARYFAHQHPGGIRSRGAELGGIRARTHIKPKEHARATNVYPCYDRNPLVDLLTCAPIRAYTNP